MLNFVRRLLWRVLVDEKTIRQLLAAGEFSPVLDRAGSQRAATGRPARRIARQPR